MEKKFSFCVIICLLTLTIPVRLFASQPVNYLMVGCVKEGMLFSLGTDDRLAGSATMQVHYIRVIPRSVNLSPYEGKKIRLWGVLRPGDVFQPDQKTIEILGRCDQKTLSAMGREMAQAYRMKAKEMASRGDWHNARAYINKAISLDRSDCSLWLTRAQFYQKQGKIAEAVKDAQQAVQQGCRRYPDLAFLAELLESAGKKAAALASYEQALAACEYQPDKERFLQSINRLKSHTHSESYEAGGQAKEGALPPNANDPEVLPLPPPLPD